MSSVVANVKGAPSRLCWTRPELTFWTLSTDRAKVAVGLEIVASVIAGLASLLAGGLVAQVARRLLGIRTASAKPYGERLAELSTSLTKASREVDSVLAEVAQVARSREAAVQKLEFDLEALESREKELKDKVEALQRTPLPVAEHFARLLESGEKRNEKRDYVLFGAGVVLTTVIAIVIQMVGG